VNSIYRKVKARKRARWWTKRLFKVELFNYLIHQIRWTLQWRAH